MTGRSRLARIAGVAGLGVGWLAAAMPLLAASPSPTGGIGGDPRSSGQGPGLVGDPVSAVVLVVAIGLVALALTLAYVRLTARGKR